jgi:hypothetical protein
MKRRRSDGGVRHAWHGTRVGANVASWISYRAEGITDTYRALELERMGTARVVYLMSAFPIIAILVYMPYQRHPARWNEQPNI